MNNPKGPNNLDIEINNETASGVYSNLALINHSGTEFVVDFIQVMPGMPKAQVKSRVVLTPQHAKRFLRALNENVHRFESQFGEIKDHESTAMPFSFGPAGEA
ncbi:MAG: DUF3467 domain-containing protein [Weeksellaceae bacterium]|nr:DUF3467 domain-containing protein [Weeksellaceae bacterium]